MQLTDRMLDILRIVFYLWAGWEIGFLTSLYRYAYEQMKKSRVIAGLVYLLTALAALFFYMTILAFTNGLDEKIYNLLKILIIIPVANVAISARIFRKRSLEKSSAEALREDLRGNK